jgi:hypothetical protein
MAKKLTLEQEQEFAQIATDSSERLSEDAFRRNLSDKRDNNLLLSPELAAFFGKEFSHLFFGR